VGPGKKMGAEAPRVGYRASLSPTMMVTMPSGIMSGATHAKMPGMVSSPK